MSLRIFKLHGLQCAAGKFLVLLVFPLFTTSIHTNENPRSLQGNGVETELKGRQEMDSAALDEPSELSIVEVIIGGIISEVRNFTGVQDTLEVDYKKNSEEYFANRKQHVQKLSEKLLPVVTRVLKKVLRMLPEKHFIQRGLDKILYTFWEPVLMLNKMAYIAWLPAVAGILSVVSENSIIAGVVFLMIIASALQKKALLAEAAAGAVSRRSLASPEHMRNPRREPRGIRPEFKPKLPKIVQEMSKWSSKYH